MIKITKIILFSLSFFILGTVSLNAGSGSDSIVITIPSATYTVYTSAGEGGTISPTSRTVNSGATTSFTITPNSGYSINTVTGCNGTIVSGSGGYTYTTGAITSSCTVTATFTPHTVSTYAVNCSISPSSRSVVYGATTTFTITPSANYHINTASGCGGSRSGSTYTTGPITSSCTVGATCVLNTYTVSTSVVGSGTVSPSSEIVSYGSNTTFSITPNSGHQISSVTGCNGTLSSNSQGYLYTTGTITSACTVTATFSIDSYTVSTSVVGNGTISPSSRIVDYGLPTTFTVTPGAGYQISSVTGCGGLLSGSTYMTGAIYNNCTVTATFVPNPVNGVCSSTHYNCTAGTSANGAESSPNWTWNCNGLYGGTNASCSEAIPKPSNLTSSCSLPGTTASLSWTLPSGYTLSYLRVYDDTAGAYAALVPDWSADTGPSFSFSSTPGHYYQPWVHTRLPSGAYSSEIYGSQFYCTPTPTGTITPETSSCVIASGASTCNVPLTWSTTNPIGTSAITASGMTTVNGNSGSQNFPVPSPVPPYTAPSRTFYLYNNAILLDQASATATCASGTTWNGSTCATNVYTVSTSVGSGGTVTPTSRSVSHGFTTFFTVTPNSGYQISSVTGCGGSLSGSTYTTGAITSACTVTATFTLAPINGVCSNPDVHYTCSVGTSANNVAGAYYWTWNCNGLYGGTSASCSETIPPPTNFTSSCPLPGTTASFSWTLPAGHTLSYFRVTDNVTGTNPSVWIPENVSDTGPSTSFSSIPGHDYTAWVHTRIAGGGYSSAVYSSTACVPTPTGTITPETSSCVIASGASTCNVPLTWSTTNPIGTSAVTASGMTTVNGNSGSQNFPVPYSSRTFYLYNNAILLDTASATATCASGTVWDGSKCATTTGDITATGCTIPEGSSSCTSTLNWSTQNPIGTSTVRTPNSSGTLIATGNSGSTTYTVPYNTRTFVLVNNGATIDSVSPIAICVSGTHWNGSICISDVPETGFTANPPVIFRGSSSTLTWSSTADSCTSTGPGFDVSTHVPSTSGSIIVSPLVDTTYTLSCTNVTGTSNDSVVTRVIDLKIKEN